MIRRSPEGVNGGAETTGSFCQLTRGPVPYCLGKVTVRVHRLDAKRLSEKDLQG